MKIQVSSDLLDGLVLALLDKQDYYGYSLTQDMQRAISLSSKRLKYFFNSCRYFVISEFIIIPPLYFFRKLNPN